MPTDNASPSASPLRSPSPSLAPSASISLDDMALFVEVARAGNFSRACERLGVPNATLSRRIAAMERRLNVRLFERSTRHVTLTDAAQRYFARCAPLVDEARLAHETLREEVGQVLGHVRVSMPVDMGVIQLGPGFADFLRAHPGVTLDLDLSPRFRDLLGDAVDVALRLGEVQGDGLVARRVGTVAQGLYAAPDYLTTHGHPEHAQALAQHDCLHIGSARRGAVWRLRRPGQAWQTVEVRGRVGINSMSLARVLAEGGMGVALLPVVLARASVERGVLLPVLPDHELPGWPVSAVTASRHQPAAVRSFIDFVTARLQAG